MSSFTHSNRTWIAIQLCLLILFSVSCSSLEVPALANIQLTPLPASTQPVEYGASLGEWEDATQADTEAAATPEPLTEITEVTESEAPVVAGTVPTATIVSDGAAPPADTTDITPTQNPVITEENTLYVVNDITYQEIMWNGLIPPDFTPDAIMAKYQPQLSQLNDGDPEASALYAQMLEEFNNAPVNEVLNETLIRIPGFIAPLEYTGNFVTEFLLVPYFGACIHVPPPPANQTVLVKTGEGQGISLDQVYDPVWVMGKLSTEGATTELAQAGYHIQDAFIEPYPLP